MGKRLVALTLLAVFALPAAAASAGGDLLATYYADSAQLGRLDARTLQPVGPQLEIPEYHRAWAVSPDGRRVAIGKAAGGRGMGIGGWIVNPATMQVATGIRAPIAVEGLAWLRPRRVVMLLQGNGVQVADPVTGEILARTQAGSDCSVGQRWARTPRALVVLAHHRVAAIDADGRRRFARLGRALPDICDGAAVGARDGKAFVVTEGAGLTEVKLSTMRVKHFRLRGRRLPRARFTSVSTLGGGRLVATHNGRRGQGVELIDTRRRTRRILHRRAGGAAVGGGRVLVYDARARIGLTAFRPDGRRVFRLLPGRRIENVQVAGRIVYAIERRRVVRVDLRSGRVISRSGRPPGQTIEFLAPGA